MGLLMAAIRDPAFSVAAEAHKDVIYDRVSRGSTSIARSPHRCNQRRANTVAIPLVDSGRIADL